MACHEDVAASRTSLKDTEEAIGFVVGLMRGVEVRAAVAYSIAGS